MTKRYLRRTILTAAALALLMTPVHAGDDEAAEGMFALTIYDSRCEKLPDAVIAIAAASKAGQISNAAKLAAQERVAKYFYSVGVEKFCAAWKVKIAIGLAEYAR